MSIDPKLMEVLACPACRVSVRYLEEESGLLCERCQRIFPVVDGIPVMLIDEARTKDSPRKPL